MKLGFKIVFLVIALISGKGLFAQNNSTYSQLIEEADLYLKIGDNGFARIDYEKAVVMNPADEYPRLKLAELNRNAITQHRNDSIFEISLLNAEKYFKAGNYNLAQIEYLRSLELKPGSVFIKGRLAAISNSVSKTEVTKPETNPISAKVEPDKAENTFASLKTENTKTEKPVESSKPDLKKQEPLIDKQTTKASIKDNNQPLIKIEDKKVVIAQLPAPPTPLQIALAQAEEFFTAKDYENAALRYQAALALKPADKAIKTKLTATRSLSDKQKKDQKAYNDIILAAEKAVFQKNTQQAITYYEQAALLKPDDASLQNKLITLRDKFNVEQTLDKNFKEIIINADKFLHDNNIAEAKKSYELARSIKPDEKYPQDKLLEISRIEAIAEADKAKKYKETIAVAESLLVQEDFLGAYQSFNKAAELQPKESYPKQKMTELNTKIKALEAQYKVAYNGFILEGNKAFQLKNWDVAMDNYLQALKAKTNDTLAGNRITKIVGYMNNKLVATLTPPAPSILEGKEVKLPFKPIESAKRANQYMVVRLKNSSPGNPRLYISYGKDAQKNGGILYRNLLKGGQYIDYVVRIANQDRWYRLDNNWISLTVEGGTLEIDSLKICSDI